MPQIKEVMVEMNPWWKEQFVLEGYRKREIYAEIQKFMPLPQIIGLTGLRRVGKTTLMLKIAEDLMKNGTHPTNVLYFSFDEFRSTKIREVLKEYENVTGKNLREGKFLILLDEVQKLAGWQDELKALYDLYKGKVKFLVSGSESLFIKKEIKEVLGGRFFEFKVNPLSFREYLEFKSVKYEPVDMYERELEKLFREFLIAQGFPELVGITDRSVVRKYLRESIVEKVIFRDLPLILGTIDVSLIESLLNLMMEEPGQLIQISELAGALGVSRKTVSNYLAYLEQSFLLRKLYNFSPSRRKVERKLKKYYPVIISVDLMFREDELSASRVLEWIVVNQLGANFFWRDPYKNEVDVVVGKEKPVPVEVKVHKVDISGLLRFMGKFGVKKGYVVTSDLEEERKIHGYIVSVLPAFKLLIDPQKYIH
jgi:predicted AAA+ superfamily ATPase